MVQHGATVHELKDLWVCGSRLRLEIDVPQRIQITSHNTGKAISTEEFVPESGNEPENNTEKSRTLL